MLLVHQAGSVKVGEVIRYTITYTPNNDRILPTPEHLYLKVKNTCAIPLRAAWIHGPYALHVSTYPSTFDPHHKVEQPHRDGVPQYEPMLKAGGSWQARLKIPELIRESGADLGRRRSISSAQHGSDDGARKAAATWVVEVTSQILFSNSASVDFEVFIGRDERSLDLGFAAVAAHGHGGPGRLHDVDTNKSHSMKRRNRQNAGVYSKAIRLTVEDTETLWNKPALPAWEQEDEQRGEDGIGDSDFNQKKKSRKQKKIHLVVLTHGLHSNTGADLLFLKESIDATVKAAREESKRRKSSYGEDKAQSATGNKPEQKDSSTAPLTGGQEDLDPDGDDDEEQTIVRGFSGNAVKTENGIQYLGKRLAKYILKMTYPDQPFLPVKKSLSRSFTDSFRSQSQKADRDGKPAHMGSSIHLQVDKLEDLDERAYKFTSISFIGHSLGGLIQTYAIAYIQKHSPTFFDIIEPVNFVTMAAPMLGLSNENPMYVKFALDFGLVGRTGQDLGLTWRPPHLAKGGWNALIAGFGAGNSQKETKQEDPTAKPLLRILPTGPAHHVLRKFRNRTLYSNVVNDGIVPLRTSCLLFLDWRGLGKVEKARRENGLIGTMAEWGWAELTGANQSTAASNVTTERHSTGIDDDDEEDDQHVRDGEGDKVPQPDDDETTEDNKKLTQRLSIDRDESPTGASMAPDAKEPEKGMLDTFLGFLGVNPTSSHNASPRSQSPQSRSSRKQIKALKRAQTVQTGEDELPEDVAHGMEGTTANPTMRPHLHQHHSGQTSRRPGASKGSGTDDEDAGELQAPPKTSIFESAGDILHPPLPSSQWITDPSTRARTIFHDRVYHPNDIPPPPIQKHSSKLMRSFSSDTVGKQGQAGNTNAADTGGMKIEEKIARAYHRDLSWRKVLVRLEPDAHNNMIVRRMFANAYGWPVIKHLCDTHFANTWAAQTRDEDEPATERALPTDAPVSPDGCEEVRGQTDETLLDASQGETRLAKPELPDSKKCPSDENMQRHRAGSIEWTDTYLEGSDDDNSDVDERGFMQRLINPHTKKSQVQAAAPPVEPRPTTPYTDGHRGLAPSSPRSSRSQVVPSRSPAVGLTGGPDSPLHSKEGPQDKKPATGGTAEVGLRKSLEEHVATRQTLNLDHPFTIDPPGT